MAKEDLSGLTCPYVGCGDILQEGSGYWRCPDCGETFVSREDYNKKAGAEADWLEAWMKQPEDIAVVESMAYEAMACVGAI